MKKKIINGLIHDSLKKNKVERLKFFWNLSSWKSSNELWVDKEGNTLAHFAAREHSSELWDFIKDKPMDLLHLNAKGVAPIHIFIERAFVQKPSEMTWKLKAKNMIYQSIWGLNSALFKSNQIIKWLKGKKIVYEIPTLDISFNSSLLHEMIKSGADINQFMEFPQRKELGWEAADAGSFSRRNIIGSPLELLIHLFWDFIIYPVFDKDMEVVKKYNQLYELLASHGANINELIRGEETIDNVKDAMQDPVVRIGSIFFCKFLSIDDDFYALNPILKDESLDFKVSDAGGNTVLHTLFARMSNRTHMLRKEVCEEILRTIVLNPSFNLEAIEYKNTFGLTPLQCLKSEEAKDYKEFFISFMRHEKLQSQLSLKESSKITRKLKV